MHALAGVDRQWPQNPRQRRTAAGYASGRRPCPDCRSLAGQRAAPGASQPTRHAPHQPPHRDPPSQRALAMAALRSALFLLFMIVTVIPYAIACLIWAPLPLRWRYRLTVGWPRMVIWAARW